MSALVLDQRVVAHIAAVTELRQRRTRWHQIKHTHSSRPAVTRRHTSVQGQHGERWGTRLPITPSYLSHANCRNNNALWARHGLVDIHHKLVQFCWGPPSLTATDRGPTAGDLSGLKPSRQPSWHASDTCLSVGDTPTSATDACPAQNHLGGIHLVLLCGGLPDFLHHRLQLVAAWPEETTWSSCAGAPRFSPPSTSVVSPLGLRRPLGSPVWGLPDSLYHRRRWVATWPKETTWSSCAGAPRLSLPLHLACRCPVWGSPTFLLLFHSTDFS